MEKLYEFIKDFFHVVEPGLDDAFEWRKSMYEAIKEFFLHVEPGLHEIFDWIDKNLNL